MKKLMLSMMLVCAAVPLIAMQSGTINISGLNKIEILKALFDVAMPRGMGILHYNPNQQLTTQEAMNILAYGYADYVHGRAMKIRIDPSLDMLNIANFETYNGNRVARSVIEKLRANQQYTDIEHID